MRSLLVAVGLIAQAPLAHAAGVVTTCSDPSLRNALVGGGTVTFALNCTITLGSTLNITANTTIDAGSHSVTLSGGGSVGIPGKVQIIKVAAATVKLSLNNLTLNGGSALAPEGRPGFGGAIENLGALTVTNCTFSNNIASSSGGAIFNSFGATATIKNSQFIANSVLPPNNGAGFGGGIYNDGTLSVFSSTFTGNFAEAGAIFNDSRGTLFVEQSTFASNTAGNSKGGAIENVSAFGGTAALVAHSTFTGNSAGTGGAIANSGDMFVSDSVFSNNSLFIGGTAGGAISNLNGLLQVSFSEFSNNTTHAAPFPSGDGGAIANLGVTAHAQLNIVQTTFVSNSAVEGGAILNSGAVGVGATAEVHNTTFLRNNALLGAVGNGGGIENDVSAQLIVDGSTFAENRTTGNGGGINNLMGLLSVTNSTFNDDSASRGSAIFNGVQGATVSYSTIFGSALSNLLIDGNPGTLVLKSTIVANHFHTTCGVSVIDGGYNLATDFSCGLSILIIADPLLLPLGNNGGPTQTMGLPPIPPATSPVSPAIGKIPNGVNGCGVPPTNVDQRGAPRPQKPLGPCDIGAVSHLFVTTPPSGTACNGVYNKTFDGDVTVLPGQSCVFIGGGITGNVHVKGGDFGLRYATVGSDVKIDGAAAFAIGPSATIGGNLEIHALPPDSPQNQVCDANVGGNLELHNNETAVEIGSTDPLTCVGNTIGGNLDVHNNSAATTVDDNRVTGDLRDRNNSGPTEVFGNNVTGTLECSQNAAIAGGLDIAAQKQGQCAGF